MTNKWSPELQELLERRRGIYDLLRNYHDSLPQAVVEGLIESEGIGDEIIEHLGKDSLTGLENRRRLEEILDEEIERSRRLKTTFSIIIVDIDKFKTINDTYGHMIGDQVLEETAKIMKNVVKRKYDTLFKGRSRIKDSTSFTARYGGEEFVAILPGVSYEDSIKLAKKMRKEIEKNVIQTKKGPIKITVSEGLAIYEGKGDKKSLLETADTLLYKAKGLGRNRVEYLERALDCENTTV